MTPSLPTRSRASAIRSPIALSLLALIAPTAATSSLLVTFLAISSSLLGGGFDGFVDAAADGGGIAAGHDVPQAFLEDGVGQDGGGRGAVAGQVGGLLGHFDHELGAHVLEAVFQLDFLGDGDAVLGDGRAAEGLVDDHVLAGRAHRGRDGLGEFFDALEHLGAGEIVEEELFWHC